MSPMQFKRNYRNVKIWDSWLWRHRTPKKFRQCCSWDSLSRHMRTIHQRCSSGLMSIFAWLIFATAMCVSCKRTQRNYRHTLRANHLQFNMYLQYPKQRDSISTRKRTRISRPCVSIGSTRQATEASTQITAYIDSVAYSDFSSITCHSICQVHRLFQHHLSKHTR